MSVEIEPAELGFHRPFTVEVPQNLKLKNPNAVPVAFKVKTTAPKQYCVRPNSGRIEPGREVDVTVLLQAMKQEPPADAKCKDKFLVQSTAITSDKEFTNIADIWAQLDTSDKTAIQERKIKVVFLPPTGQEPARPAAPVHAAVTPMKNLVNGNHEATPDVTAPYASPEDARSAPPPSSVVTAHETTREPEAESYRNAEAESKPTIVELTMQQLKEQLADAEAVIAGLRQTKPATDTGDKSAAASSSAPSQLAQAVRTGTEGVPLQIAAALCFLSFIIAYFFF